jgi:hypothetical protein
MGAGPGLPAEGTLPLDTAIALADVLARHTATPDRCWFAVWEGFGALRPEWRTSPCGWPCPSGPWCCWRGRWTAASIADLIADARLEALATTFDAPTTWTSDTVNPPAAPRLGGQS